MYPEDSEEELFQGCRVHFQKKVVLYNYKQYCLKIVLFLFLLLLHFNVRYFKRGKGRF